MNRPRQDKTFRPELHADISQEIMREFAKELTKELISNEDGVMMPGNFGTILIEGKEKRAVNHKETKKYGKLIYHQNYHTDGLSFTTTLYIGRLGHKPVRRVLLLTPFKFKPYDKLKIEITKACNRGDWRHFSINYK